MAHSVQVDALALLRNHIWKMQALIVRRWSDSRFVVVIQPLPDETGYPELGAPIAKEFEFDKFNDAYRHARTVLGYDAIK